jgi:ACS family hexuronate transporter-like MFS transporter
MWMMNGKLLSMILLMQVTCSWAFFAYIPLIPLISADLDLNGTKIGFLSTASGIGGILFGLASGIIVDRLQTRIMILLGPGLLLLGIFFISIASSYLLFLIGVILMGLGYGFILPLTNRLISFYFPPHRWAFTMSVKQSGSTIGQSLGALLLPGIALAFSWNASLQVVSAVLFIVSILCYWYFYSMNTTEPNSAKTGFHREEKRTRLPPHIVILLCIGFSFLAFQCTLVTFLIPYLHRELNWDIQLAAMVLAITQIIGAVGRPLLGWVSDTLFHGGRKVILVLCGFLNVAMLSALVFSPFKPMIFIIILLIVMGISSFGWVGIYFTALVEQFGKERSGAGTGYGVMANSAGAATGPILFGFTLDHSSYALAFLVLILWMGAISCIALLFFREGVTIKAESYKSQLKASVDVEPN